MAKSDFCFNYYDGDATRDMAHMNRLERGAYTDVIIQQRQRGHLSMDDLKKFLSKDFDAVWAALEWVLKVDGAGKYYIEWLENSEIKAKAHSERQKKNRAGNDESQGENDQTTTNSSPLADQKAKVVEPKATLVAPLEDGNGYGNGNEKGNGSEQGGVGGKEKSLHVQMREKFLEGYERKTKLRFSWDGKSAKHLKEIIPKIETKIGNKDEKEVLKFWEIIIEHLPDWQFQNNFSPAGISSRFNEIVQKINKSNATNNTTVDAKLAEVIARGNPYLRKTG